MTDPYQLGASGGYVAPFTVEAVYDEPLIRPVGSAIFDFVGMYVRCDHCGERLRRQFDENELWDSLTVHAARHAPKPAGRPVESTRPL